jgi:AraC-like DNA-binding protein
MAATRLYKSELVELAQRCPTDTLRRYVRRYTAWRDSDCRVVRRRHVPAGTVPLIINFTARVRLSSSTARSWSEHQAFTAGLHDAFTISESTGPNLGVQVDFTALGARLFYNRPLDDFANRSVECSDVLGLAGDRLASRLFDASTWDERFDLLDAEIAARIGAARSLPPEIEWTWRMLTRSAGGLRIAALRDEIGWSERHFAATFRREFGLAPKGFARVLRFGRAVDALSSGEAAPLADVALACGYYDQAHFNRDFQRFAGVTPRALLDSRSSPGPGFSA